MNKSNISFFIESIVSYPAVVSVIYDITEPHEVKYQDEQTVSTVYLTQTSPHYLEVSKYSYVRDIQTQSVHIVTKLQESIETRVGFDEPDDVQLEGYDGPNVLCRGLNATEMLEWNEENGPPSKHYVQFDRSRGFQMTLRMIFIFVAWFPNRILRVHYQTQLLQSANIIVNKRVSNYTMPNSDCQVDSSYMRYCLIHVSARDVSLPMVDRGFIRVTLTEVELDGPNTDNCLLSGLAMVSTTNNSKLTGFITKQNPVVVVCRNTLMWGEGGAVIPFTNFTSHTSDVILALYSYTPSIGQLRVTLTLTHTECQGYLLNCHTLKYEAFINESFASALMNQIIVLNDTHYDIKTRSLKISRLESIPIQRRSQHIHGECFALFHDKTSYKRDEQKSVYVRDLASAWCKRSTYTGIPNTQLVSKSYFHANLYSTDECIVIQALPTMRLYGSGKHIQNCLVEIEFIDTQARFKVNQFSINTVH